jgi:hypothetical protein
MRGNKGLLIGRTLLMAVGGLVLATAMVQAKDDYPSQINVCVRGAGEEGFVAGEVADSVKDLQKHLDGKKVLRLVDRARDAEVIVTVVGRDNELTGRSTYRSHSSGHHYSSTTTKETVRVVRAVLKAGSYEQEMYGVDNIWWGIAAKDLAKKVEKWVESNYGQIIDRRDRR